MDDELTPEQKFAADAPKINVPRDLLSGRAPEDVVADLVRLDWSPRAARALVDRVWDDLCRYHHSPESRRQLVDEARRQLIGGILLMLLAVVVVALLAVVALTLLVTLRFALTLGLAAFVLFLGGAIVTGRGWARWRLYRKETLPFKEGAHSDERPAKE